jgi:hypothetical protein
MLGALTTRRISRTWLAALLRQWLGERPKAPRLTRAELQDCKRRCPFAYRHYVNGELTESELARYYRGARKLSQN